MAYESFPLQWPLGRERTASYRRENSSFKTTIGKARDELFRELKLLSATNIVVSSNIATYKKGGQEIMYADQRKSIEDPGVAIYYTWKREQYVLSCDKWKTVVENLQSLVKTINAIRSIERWGTGEMMKAAFQGFKEIPAAPKPPKPEESIWDVLGLSTKPASPDVVKDAFRRLSKERHPDMPGGSTIAFQKLNDAYQKAMAFYN